MRTFSFFLLLAVAAVAKPVQSLVGLQRRQDDGLLFPEGPEDKLGDGWRHVPPACTSACSAMANIFDSCDGYDPVAISTGCGLAACPARLKSAMASCEPCLQPYVETDSAAFALGGILRVLHGYCDALGGMGIPVSADDKGPTKAPQSVLPGPVAAETTAHTSVAAPAANTATGTGSNTGTGTNTNTGANTGTKPNSGAKGIVVSPLLAFVGVLAVLI